MLVTPVESTACLTAILSLLASGIATHRTYGCSIHSTPLPWRTTTSGSRQQCRPSQRTTTYAVFSPTHTLADILCARTKAPRSVLPSRCPSTGSSTAERSWRATSNVRWSSTARLGTSAGPTSDLIRILAHPARFRGQLTFFTSTFLHFPVSTWATCLTKPTLRFRSCCCPWPTIPAFGPTPRKMYVELFPGLSSGGWKPRPLTHPSFFIYVYICGPIRD